MTRAIFFHIVHLKAVLSRKVILAPEELRRFIATVNMKVQKCTLGITLYPQMSARVGAKAQRTGRQYDKLYSRALHSYH